MTIPEEIDQLKIQISKETDEKQESELIMKLLDKYTSINPADSRTYIERLLQLSEKLASGQSYAWGLHYHSIVDRIDRNYSNSINFAEKALHLFKRVEDKRGMASVYHNIGLTRFGQDNYSDAIGNFELAIQVGRLVTDKHLVSASYINLANVSMRLSEYPEARKNYLVALELKKEVNDKKGVAVCFNNLGVVYKEQGNYPEAMKYHLSALKIRQEIQDKHGMSSSYHNIGNVYELQSNYPEAMRNYLQGLEIEQNIGKTYGIAYSFNNIGNIHTLQGNYTDAMKNYLRALEISKKQGESQAMADSYSNIGRIYNYQSNYLEALKNHFLSLQISEKIDDKRGIMHSYNNVAMVYFEQKNHEESIRYNICSIKISEEIGHKEMTKISCYSLTSSYKGIGDFENALKYYEKYHQLESEMLGQASQKQLNNLNFQHNMEQKEKEAEIERLKNVELKEALEKLQLEKNRSEQLFQNQMQDLKSNALQAQMNPHFVFNSLNAIQQYIWEKDPEEATAYLNRFAKLIRSVLDNSRRQFVTLEQDLTALGYYIELESVRFENKFEYQLECDTKLDKKAIQLPPMLIQPFVENAIIHGLQPLVTNARLFISLKQRDGNILHIIIEDNGVGRQHAGKLKAGKERTHQSVALQLTEERLEKMNGGELMNSIIIHDLTDIDGNAAGTKVEINVPVEYIS